MLLNDALPFVAGEICLLVHSLPKEATEKAVIYSSQIKEEEHTTWLVKGRRLFNLIKTKTGTLVYCHDNDMLYYANPNVWLKESCPDGHVFLIQVFEDNVPQPGKDNKEPRGLVMDMVYPTEQDPKVRGSKLRALTPVMPPLFQVQWAGDRSALEGFIKTGLPHEVECMVVLRSPLKLFKDIGIGIEIDPDAVPQKRRKHA